MGKAIGAEPHSRNLSSCPEKAGLRNQQPWKVRIERSGSNERAVGSIQRPKLIVVVSSKLKYDGGPKVCSTDRSGSKKGYVVVGSNPGFSARN